MKITNHITKEVFVVVLDDAQYVVTFYRPDLEYNEVNKFQVASKVETWDDGVPILLEDPGETIRISELVFLECRDKVIESTKVPTRELVGHWN